MPALRRLRQPRAPPHGPRLPRQLPHGRRLVRPPLRRDDRPAPRPRHEGEARQASPFHGVAIKSIDELPFAWVRAKEAHVYRFDGDKPEKTDETLGAPHDPQALGQGAQGRRRDVPRDDRRPLAQGHRGRRGAGADRVAQGGDRRREVDRHLDREPGARRVAGQDAALRDARVDGAGRHGRPADDQVDHPRHVPHPRQARDDDDGLQRQGVRGRGSLRRAPAERSTTRRGQDACGAGRAPSSCATCRGCSTSRRASRCTRPTGTTSSASRGATAA